MGIKRYKIRIPAILALLLLSGSFSGFAADELSYDPYAATLRQQAPSSAAKNLATHFLVYPFELLRWPMDKGLVVTEKYRLDKKAQWIYDQITDQGITPQMNVVSLGSFGAGADVDMIRLARLKEQFPDAVLKNWVKWTRDVIFETGSKVGLERIAGTDVRGFGFFNYEMRPEENFYGIGPRASAGDGTSFRMEVTTLQASMGYRANPSLLWDNRFAYQNINITSGRRGGRGIIDTTFPVGTIPGLAGDEIITLGTELNWDTRNLKESSTRGGLHRIGFSYHDGVAGSNARYFKYEGELSRYYRLRSDRRVLAFHLYGEHNDEIGDHYVPFHQMAKLGGFGSYPRMSRTLRGYDWNRFFDESSVLLNLEYRYTIWQYRDWKMDTVLFWDEGQVFGEISNFKFSDLRESYGLGFRVSALDHVIFSVEVAHADEGTNVYVKSSAPF